MTDVITALQYLRRFCDKADVHEKPIITLAFKDKRERAYFDMELKRAHSNGDLYLKNVYNTDSFDLAGFTVNITLSNDGETR